MGMDLVCPAEEEYTERADRCPTGDGLLGRCTHNAGKEAELEVYYYVRDDVEGDAASFFKDSCERGEGIWSA